jgi:CheY-like chemotaxis protein
MAPPPAPRPAQAGGEAHQGLGDDDDRADQRGEHDGDGGRAGGDGVLRHAPASHPRFEDGANPPTAVQKEQTDGVPESASRPRLLIVDDGPDMVRLLETVTAATWDVYSAANMAEAVGMASDHAVDVAVVDFMLPGGGGFSVARRLKELQPDCRVVMFSAAPVGHQAADSPDVDEFVMKGDLRVIRRVLDDLARQVRPDS